VKLLPVTEPTVAATREKRSTIFFVVAVIVLLTLTAAGDERKGYDKRKSKSHSPRVHGKEFHLGVSERTDGGLACLLAR
jgi:hypothetical protein